MRLSRNLAKQSLFSLGMLGFVLMGTHLFGVNATVTQPVPALQQGTPTASFEVSNLADNGAGSLRQALLDANSMAGADTITFSVNGTINLEGSLPSINDNVMINGPGANLLTVRRNIGGTYRIFTVNTGVTATISGLTLTNGLQDNGGGILNTGTLTVNNCLITGNAAPDGGGGVFNRGTLTMNGCTISGNDSANVASGGLWNLSSNTPATATLTNCTISGNTTGAVNPTGSGIDNSANVAGASVSLINCTIANNSAPNNPDSGGLYSGKTSIASITLKNTIVAGNSNIQVRQEKGGTVTSLGNNLISDNSLVAAAGDLLNTNPLLATLGNYGGATATLALLPNSPAINAGSNSGAPATDQRGIARPQQSTTDIGAFESRGFTLLASNGSGQATLINTNFANPLVVAVSSSFSEPVNGGRINFTPPGSGASATIGGNPATITSGTATSGTVTANNTGGGPYNVAANARGATAAVNFSLTNTVPDVTPPTASVSAANVTTGGGTSYQFTITYNDNNAINVSTVGNGDANVSKPGGFNVAATFVSVNLNSNGTPRTATYQFTPPGGTWDGADNGTYTITMNANQVADTTGNFVAAGTLGTFTVTICAPITVNPTNPALPNGRAGVAYSQTFTQTGGAGTITWSVSAGSLPGGLTLTGGVLAGTPSAFGSFSFTIKATDSNGCMGTQAYTLTIIPPCATITINPSPLPNGFQSQPYNQTLTATGGTAPYSFVLTTGSLPNGLNLASGGALTGIPTAVGTFNFTVTATDSTGCTGTRSYTVIISGNGLQFYPLAAPVRLLDTRLGTSPNACTQPNAPIAGQTALLQPGRNTCSIPANALALTGNITTVNSGGGFLTLYPSDAQRPTVASTNYGPNEIINNVFTVGLGTDGAFRIFAQNTTDVVVDVTGYYAPPTTDGLFFHPLPAPVRLLETRTGQLIGCVLPGAPLAGGSETTQQAISSCTGIPATARAIVGNATTVGPQSGGFLTIFPADATRPLVATSNFNNGQIVNGPFAVGLSANGQFKLYTTSTTHLVVDVLGYYSTEAVDANGAGLLFSPLTRPVRLLETRANQNIGCFKPGAPLASGSETTQTARGICDGITIPANALGLVGNATVVIPGGAGFLTLWPSTAARPTIATLNYNPGDVGNRHFIVGLGLVDGAFKLYTQATTDLVIDLSGYFAP